MYGALRTWLNFCLDIQCPTFYNTEMSKELTIISPENLTIAEMYLQKQNPEETALALNLPLEKVTQALETREARRFIDSVYLDRGYRNRHKIGDLMDEIIESKLEEARETEMFTKKDLLDVLQIQHKMRMDEMKAMAELEKNSNNSIKSQTNIQNNFGPGGANYHELLNKLINNDPGPVDSSN